jgi:hypothetical protein
MKLRLVAMLSLCLLAFPAIATEQFDSEQAAQQHCPSDTVIWQNLRSGSVHAKGQPWYGKTHVGAYICRKEVIIKGGKVVADATPEKTVEKPAEQWRKVVEDDNRTVYVAPSPAARDGHMVTILSLVDLRKAATLGDGTAYLSWETQYRFDCKKHLSRIEAASMYAGNMGEGEVAGSVVYEDPEWKFVPKGSNGELLWKAACGRK